MVLAPDFVTRFDRALTDERRRLEGDNGKDACRSLARRKARAEKGLEAIVRQAEQGKGFDAPFARAGKLEADVEDPTCQITAPPPRRPARRRAR